MLFRSGIQIVRIEALHPRLHLVILRVAQVLVLILAVPRIEAVEADQSVRSVFQESEPPEARRREALLRGFAREIFAGDAGVLGV